MPTERDPGARPEESLTRPLAVAILTPVLLLVVVGVVLYRQVRQLSRTARMVDHSAEVVATSNTAYKQILDQETGVRGYLITGDKSFLEPYDRAAPRPLLDRMIFLTSDNAPQNLQALEIRRRYETWLADAVAALGGELEAGRSIATMQVRKGRMKSLREVLDAFIREEERLAAARKIDARLSEEASERLLIALLIFSALVMAFLSRRQLGSVASTFRTALARAQSARDQAAGETQLRTAQLELTAAMQGDLTVPEVTARALAALVNHTGAAVGAIYVADGVRLRRMAGHALGDLDISFGPGEGLPGQAARDGKLLRVHDLPAGHLGIKSGSGESKPAEVAVLPVVLRSGKTLAVIELGFTKTMGERPLAVLQQATEPLAIGLASAQAREKLRELLEETQRQSEELQTQQEELRVANEELEEHTRSLNAAHVQLEEQQVTLEESNENLSQQREELLAAQAELTQQAEELAQASKYKSEFLANMSHELRTPLNSSLILARLLADNKPGTLTAEQVKFAETIYSAGNDLLTLINDILDIAKVEAGMLSVRPSAVSPQALLESLVRIFQPLAREKRLALELTADPEVPRLIHTDRERVEQILRNFLSNAIKFTEQGGVKLQVSHQHGEIYFTVSDTGIGIPTDQHSKVFEPFRQVESGNARRFGGTGLGLSISRDLANLLGGRIELSSKPGHGSTFTLILPVGEPGTATATPAPQPPRARGMSSRRPSVPMPRVSPPVTSGGNGRRLLVIDDDTAFSEIVAKLAGELGFEVHTAGAADEGVAMARELKPAAIVLDIGLPDHSGLTVLDRLKRDPQLRHVPVHVISSSDYAHAAREMGAAGYALKPVAKDQLIGVLRGLESLLDRAVRRLLIVEDDEVQRESMAKLLAADDLVIDTVSTAGEAIKALRASSYDCVVLDMTLPDASGFRVLEDLSADGDAGLPPVIVYTARTLSPDEELRLRRFSASIIMKGARSPERLLDEVSLFLHQVEARLPAERQRMLEKARSRDEVLDGRRILLVEDDVRNIYALTSVLEGLGAHVDIARNGREAVERVARGPAVDLVLMDIMMPEMDGLEATRRIRAQSATAKLPIIALTARAMRDDQARCLEAGANDYVSKPIDVQKLLSVARVWMPRT